MTTEAKIFAMKRLTIGICILGGLLILLVGCNTADPKPKSGIHDHTLALAYRIADGEGFGPQMRQVKVDTRDVTGRWDPGTSRYVGENGRASETLLYNNGRVEVLYKIGPNGERDGAGGHEPGHVYSLGVHGIGGHPRNLRKYGLNRWH